MRYRIAFLFLLVSIALGCEKSVRFATFNASLNRDKPGQLVKDMSTKDNPQIKNVAEIIQRTHPDILLINEFDYDSAGRAAYLFQKNYLDVPQNGATPIHYAYHYIPPVNTGVASGFDLDHNGKATTTPGTREYGGDAIGFGMFPGQYGMLLLSKYPIDTTGIRTFERFKWNQMPGAMLPTDSEGKPWYSDEMLSVMRLSSKNHCDVPVSVGDKTFRVLISHPTPPAFDGPEDRNGKRNHDEIRFWADYLRGSGPAKAKENPANYIIDDTNERGGNEIHQKVSGMPANLAAFVLMGDLNADPNDGGGVSGAIEQLLRVDRVNATFKPTSVGAKEAAAVQGGANAQHKTPAETDTADFADTGDGPGNLRCDYVLPSTDFKIVGGGVFWPPVSDPLSRLVKMDPAPASSDHRLVYLDLKF